MARKSSFGGIIIGVIVVVLVAAGAIWAKGYYDETYASKTYYTRVPESTVLEIQDITSDSGENVSKGYKYELTAYSESGEKKDVSFVVQTEDIADLYQPGTYLKVEASEKRVMNQSAISKSDVPASVVNKLG